MLGVPSSGPDGDGQRQRAPCAQRTPGGRPSRRASAGPPRRYALRRARPGRLERLANTTPLTLDEADVARVRWRPHRPGRGRRTSTCRCPAHRPLRRRDRATARRDVHVPRRGPGGRRFVIGSPARWRWASRRPARILRELLSRWPGQPRVELVTTDGLPAAQRRARARAGCCSARASRSPTTGGPCCGSSTDVKSGAARCAPGLLAPDLRHRPRRRGACARPTCSSSRASTCCSRPSRADGRPGRVAVSDFFDFSSTSTPAPTTSALVRRSASCASADGVQPRRVVLPPLRCAQRREAVRTAETVWTTINEPTSSRTSCRPARGPRCVLSKGADHSVRRGAPAQA
jgi:type I pantothenate kinase